MLKCSFCGKESETVIRIALDKNYDRLTVKHDVKYACPACSKKKEKTIAGKKETKGYS